MKLSVISDPQAVQDYQRLSDLAVQRLHSFQVRKPHWTKRQLEAYLQQMPPRLRQKAVIHSHFDLADRYRLWGIHLPRKHFERWGNKPQYFEGYRVVSASVGQLQDLWGGKVHRLEYFFVSPVFDSLSKENHTGRWGLSLLKEVLSISGVVSNKAFALGGIAPDRVTVCRGLGFGGVAALGYVWQASCPSDQVLRLWAKVCL